MTFRHSCVDHCSPYRQFYREEPRRLSWMGKPLLTLSSYHISDYQAITWASPRPPIASTGWERLFHASFHRLSIEQSAAYNKPYMPIASTAGSGTNLSNR